MNRFWRGIAIFALGGVLGTGLGVAVGFFIFPYVFPPPAASDQLTANERSNLIASGTFIHANPSDPVHYGKGRVSVHERTVFLESDFEVGPGPAFHVYLVPKASIRSSSDVKDAMFVDLGGLPSGDRLDAARRLVREEAARPFDLRGAHLLDPETGLGIYKGTSTKGAP